MEELPNLTSINMDGVHIYNHSTIGAWGTFLGGLWNKSRPSEQRTGAGPFSWGPPVVLTQVLLGLLDSGEDLCKEDLVLSWRAVLWNDSLPWGREVRGRLAGPGATHLWSLHRLVAEHPQRAPLLASLQELLILHLGNTLCDAKCESSKYRPAS